MAPVIATAGWNIPSEEAARFGADGSALQRYAGRLGGVEINSSFHRPHRRATWERWAESVPSTFRFAVKMPKAISHERKLVACDDVLALFLDEVSGLGEKLAILLLQLPPRLGFDADVAMPFFARLSAASTARLVCEPRHPDWFEPGPNALLESLGIARVAADPSVVPAAAVPGGWRGLSYWRLHGSPRIYRSSYDDDRLDLYAEWLREDERSGRPAWCVFDNTAGAAATANALSLAGRL